MKEAAAYKEKVDEIFKTMSLMLTDDHKDAIHATVSAFKKLMAKHWGAMKDTDVEIVIQLICDLSGVYLCQTLTECGIDVVEAV